jgi:hypothetical protein
MSLATLQQFTQVNGYSPSEEALIRAALDYLYGTATHNGSATARAMLDKVSATNPLEIRYVSGSMSALAGLVKFDFARHH